MKKILIIPIMLILTSFLVVNVIAVSADSFNINIRDTCENNNLNCTNKLSIWHDAGRLPTYNPFSWFWHIDSLGIPYKNHWSNGITPSGRGTFEISIWDYKINKRETINLNFLEKEVYANSDGIITVDNIATGIHWINGTIPRKINIPSFRYVYNTNNQIVNIYANGDMTFSATQIRNR